MQFEINKEKKLIIEEVMRKKASFLSKFLGSLLGAKGKKDEYEKLEIINNHLVHTIKPFYAEEGQVQVKMIDLYHTKITYNSEAQIFLFYGDIKVVDCLEFEDPFEEYRKDNPEYLTEDEIEKWEVTIGDYFEPSIKSELDSRGIRYDCI